MTAPRAPSERLQGRRLAGGRHSLRLFSRLLGLGRVRGGPRVQRVCWLEDRVEIAVGQGGRPELVLVIEGRRDEHEPVRFLASRRLQLWYRAQHLPAGLQLQLEQSVKRWAGLDLQRLQTAMAADPELAELPQAAAATPAADPMAADQDGARPGAASGGPDAEREAEPFPVGVWAPDETFGDFFATETLELMPYEPIEAANPFVRISHSDLECLSFMPREKAANLNLVDFPWISAQGDAQQQLKALETTLCTDLTEEAVILGCNAKVGQAMDRALALAGEAPVIFTNTCLPATTSEDVVSVLGRYRQDEQVKVVSHNRADTQFDEDMLEGLLVDRRLTARAGLAAVEPAGVNLVGYARDRNLDQLAAMLAELDIAVNTAVLPEVAAADMDRYPRAALCVFGRCSRYWDHFYQQLRRDCPIPWIAPPQPYGVAGTRAWLAAVAEALDRGGAVDTIWQRHFAPLAERWAELRRRAAEQTVGLVVGSRDLVSLQDPGCTAGAPLLAVLTEAGFQLEIAVRSGAGCEGLADRVAALEALGEGCRIETFRDLDGLRRLLAAGRSTAVVSNYSFDWRLSEAGKNRIGLRLFEPGLGGALRTVGRILDTCRVPFRRRYARHLSRTAMGLRPRRG
jgi:hypothetical protein